ncbi:hypothetical protein [Paracoccus aminovorans]|uniref:hypothetical protein n=1 Tax=Paracoccus aminovorans TaxID=34004 RepID=UPI002B25B7CF|nr:hypothetical protein [Paracoccus aminovorans]
MMKEYCPVVQALIGQEAQRQNAAYQQQLRQQDPMYQAQLAKLVDAKPADNGCRSASPAHGCLAAQAEG